MAQGFAAKDIAAQISDWSPSYANLTIGNGIVVARYQQVGKVVWFYFSLDFGTTTSITAAAPRISYPVIANLPTNDLGLTTVGRCYFRDASGTTYVGQAIGQSQTDMKIQYLDSFTAAVRSFEVTATAPFTWATNDRLVVVGSYEAA